MLLCNLQPISSATSSGSPLTVATTGTWNIHPNVYNAVPRGASILLDIRDVDYDRRQQVIDAVLKGAQEIGEKWKTPTKAEVLFAHPPITSSDMVSSALSFPKRLLMPEASSYVQNTPEDKFRATPSLALHIRRFLKFSSSVNLQ